MSVPHFAEPMTRLLEHELSSQHGPLMTGEHLWVALGYPSKEAFRQAVVRKKTPIPIFGIEKRRGRFALTKDVAAWLAAQRADAVAQFNPPVKGENP
jgi:hypothetical protein